MQGMPGQSGPGMGPGGQGGYDQQGPEGQGPQGPGMGPGGQGPQGPGMGQGGYGQQGPEGQGPQGPGMGMGPGGQGPQGPGGQQGSFNTGDENSFQTEEYRGSIRGAINSFDESTQAFTDISNICGNISGLVASEDSNISGTLQSLGEISSQLKTKCDSIRGQLNTWIDRYAATTDEQEGQLHSSLESYNEEFNNYLSQLNSLATVKSGRTGEVK